MDIPSAQPSAEPALEPVPEAEPEPRSGTRRAWRFWRWLVPMLLVLLFLAVLIWLPWQARQMEATERQEQLIADTLWVEQTLRFELARSEEALAALGADLVVAPMPQAKLQARLRQMFKNGPELARVVWSDADGVVQASFGADLPAAGLPETTQMAAELARSIGLARYGEPYGATRTTHGLIDFYLPLYRSGRFAGSLVATYSLQVLLDETVPWWFAQDNALSLIDRDELVVARRASGGPGRGIYTHQRELDLPGAQLVLRTNSVKNAPQLLPNLLVGSVIALALGLLASLAALWRHISRTLAAENALRQQMAFRTAMENSLLTGLRARDLEGRVTYVNRAFCQIVGFPYEELVGKKPPMPYWAPEAMADYEERFMLVLSGNVTPQFETVFQRSDGVRVPVLVFEAPLYVDGRHTGWMSSVLDITDRKRVEELNRQQEEKLQASARLATMGELSSMLAHELNQPLAAISSYTAGALNVLERVDRSGEEFKAGMLRHPLEQARQQAQRAGQIIRSVHEFVKKREPQRTEVTIRSVVDGVRALVELQARQAAAVLRVQVPPGLSPVLADRVLLEQVLLNLTRNGIQAMQETRPEQRVLRIEASQDNGVVSVSVIDRGHGISPEVAERLFSPFYSTKAEGMGMGLSICRTAIEFHGGTLTHTPDPSGGTVFTFSLPAHAGDAALR